MKKIAVLNSDGKFSHYKHYSRRQWHKALVVGQKAEKKALHEISFKHKPRWRQLRKLRTKPVHYRYAEFEEGNTNGVR